MSETSPTPWKVVKEIGKDQTMPFLLTTSCEDEWNVAAVFGDVPHLPAEANAALIARAVNCHAEMVEALEACRSELASIHGMHGNYQNALEHSYALRRADAALARATQTNTGE